MTNFNDKRAAVMTVLSTFDLDSSAVWNCHGTPVILHKALEAVADKAGIIFDAPQIIETDAKGKIAVICVTGRRDGRTAWSFGEAMPSNNKNAYPFAMAEKRAKDRVILKLIGLSGEAYSEDEADDFKSARPADPAMQAPSTPRVSKAGGRDLYTRLQADIDAAGKDMDALTTWANHPPNIADINTLPDDWQNQIRTRYREARAAAKQEQAA